MMVDERPEGLPDRRGATDQLTVDAQHLDAGLLAREEGEVRDPVDPCCLAEETRGSGCRDQCFGVGEDPPGKAGFRQEPFAGYADTLETGCNRGNDTGSGEPDSRFVSGPLARGILGRDTERFYESSIARIGPCLPETRTIQALVFAVPGTGAIPRAFHPCTPSNTHHPETTPPAPSDHGHPFRVNRGRAGCGQRVDDNQFFRVFSLSGYLDCRGRPRSIFVGLSGAEG